MYLIKNNITIGVQDHCENPLIYWPNSPTGRTC